MNQQETNQANQQSLDELKSKFSGLSRDITLSRFDWRAMMESGCTVNLHVARYRGTMALTSADLGLDAAEMTQVQSIVDLGQRLLLPKDVLNQFNNLESSARQDLRRYCLKTPVGFFLPQRAYAGCAARMQEYQKRFFDLIDILLAELYSHEYRMGDEYRTLAYQVCNRLDSGAWEMDTRERFVDEFIQRCMANFPTAEQLRKSFAFELRLQFVALPYQEDAIVTPTYADSTDELMTMRTAVLESQRAARDELVNGFMLSIQEEIYGAVNQSLQDVLGSIKKTGQLQSRSSIQLKNLVEKIGTLNFWQDKRLDIIQREIIELLDRPSKARDLKFDTSLLEELEYQSKSMLLSLQGSDRSDLGIRESAAETITIALPTKQVAPAPLIMPVLDAANAPIFALPTNGANKRAKLF